MAAAAFKLRFLPRFRGNAGLLAPAAEPSGPDQDIRACEQARREFALDLMYGHPDAFSSGESVIEAMFYISGRH